MLVKDIRDPFVQAFNVLNIRFSGRLWITVSYDIYYKDNKEKSQSTSVWEEPHQDFMKSLIEMQMLAQSMIEIPMVNRDGEECLLNIKSINFLKSENYGRGVKFKLAVEGLSESKDPVIINTQSFYEHGPHSKKNILGEELYPLQQLDERQLFQLQKMAMEAIKLVYYNKRTQPTLEEAVEAVVNGGYPDELVEKEEEQDGHSTEPETQSPAD